jgi:sialate O-acetylesterase
MISLLTLPLLPPQDGLKMPAVFADHMVLQRQKPIPFFGIATPGKTITVKLENQYATTTVRPDGTWKLELRPREAGGPYLLEVSGDGYLRFQDVMVGEVWLASGQSNMEWVIGQQNDIPKARTDANSNLRMFTVSRSAREEPTRSMTGSGWMVANDESVVYFSAVGFWFANDLYKWLNVPIGVINASWGGTPAESWVRRDALRGHPSLAYMVNEYLDSLRDYPSRKAAYDRALAQYKERAFAKDTGNEGAMNGFASINLPTSDWKPCTLPNLIEVTQGEQFDGAVWYRRTLDLPTDWAGKSLAMELGTIDDFDDVYFNGRRLGGVDREAEYPYAVPRRYIVPPALIREKGNVLAVRVFDQGGSGGFTGAADTMRLVPVEGGTPIKLAGTWLSKIERRVSPPDPTLVGKEPERPFGPGHPWAPGALWNGMIAPYVGYGMRGAIWYQGESNVERAEEYRTLFSFLINDWRGMWGAGDFPFYLVQLAAYMGQDAEPRDSTWAELREAQQAALDLPNTGMALALDLGDANDIHPRNKLEVGRRLSLLALAKTYDVPVQSRGPHFREHRVEGNSIRVFFDDAKGLKTFDGSAPAGFAIAGADRVFRWANVRVDGESVIVSSPAVPQPVAVRYAWSTNPVINLYNESALPAEPFRTDDWPRITAGNRKR